MKIRNKLLLGGTLALMAGKAIDKLVFPQKNHVAPNTRTTFNVDVDNPKIEASAYIHPKASVMGKVEIGREVLVAPFASIRGDEGLRIYIGNCSNIQDGAVLHGLKNFEYGNNIAQNSVFEDASPYSIYIGDRVSITQQCHIQGPTRIDSDVFVGMQSLVFDAHIKQGSVLEPGCKVMGVTVPEYRYVTAGTIVATQEQADQLPAISRDYKFAGMNQQVVAVNRELAQGYRKGL